MRPSDLARLVVLAAIWGASFMFMRILAPVLGPLLVADLRILLAGIALAIWLRVIGREVGWRRHGGQYLAIGVVNSAVPFLFYAFAALHIPAGYSAILNATAPLFGLVLGAIWLADRPGPAKLMGAGLGLSGVALLTRLGPVALSRSTGLAIAACLGAALCYAIAGIYIKRRGAHLHPAAIAGASQLLGGLALLPVALLRPPPGPVTPAIAGCMVALALVCSGVAYLLYYRLIADCGPANALTVTFLIPVFGVAWGKLVLQEPLTPGMIAGAALVVAGTALIVRPRAAAPAAAPAAAR